MVYCITADAGSSKTAWIVSDEAGNELTRIQTAGLNAVFATREEVFAAIDRVRSQLSPEGRVARVRFYGAGCSTPELCANMQSMLAEGFGAEDIEVASDLLGAAKGLLGDKPGVACILGTGSNSCLYDGEKITAHTPSMGYVLGDEGSGSAIGKRLLADALKGQMPAELAEELLREYGLDVATAIEKVYRRPAANRFLASLAPFAAKHRDRQYIRALLTDEFGRFLDRNIAGYEGVERLPVCFTGGIAHNFREILREVCESRGYRMGKVSAMPFDKTCD